MMKKLCFTTCLTVASIGFAGTAMAAPGDNGKANGVRGRQCAQSFDPSFSSVGEGLQFRRQMIGNNAGGVPAALLEFGCP